MSTRKEKVESAQAKRLKPLPKVKEVTDLKVTTNDKPESIVSTAPPTFSDMLAPLRQSLVQEKTDAAKMQKYYALTDALGAIGKMGGAAIGGAIGGNVLDSAPAVGEYQPSRGYIDAFGRAQKANESLRAFDNNAFQLAYSKQQRDEEREYARKQKEEDRAWQAAQQQAAREFQAEQARITREWNKALADEDFAKQAALKKEILALQEKYAAADDERAKAYLQLQHDLYNIPHPVKFSDGSVLNLTTQQLEDMLENFNGQTIGGVKVNEDNFGTVLRKNPQAFADYFRMIGVSSDNAGAYGATMEPKGVTVAAPEATVEPVPEATVEPAPKKRKGNWFPSGARGLAPIVQHMENPEAEANKQTDKQGNKENDSRIQIDW